MELQYVITGGGGHALSLAEAIGRTGGHLIGYTAPLDQGPLAQAYPWLGDDSALPSLLSPALRLLNGLGSTGPIGARAHLYQKLLSQGFEFAELIHPSASVARLQNRFGPGLAVLGGAVINAGVHCAENVLINSGAIVEHGCVIGKHSHIASGAVLCGDVTIGDGVHVGAGSTILQGIQIGAGAVIAAGAVVTENVEPLTLIAGVPGRIKHKIEP